MQVMPGPVLPAVVHQRLSGEGGTSVLVDPTTGRQLTTVAQATEAEADQAIDRAHAAFPAWRAVAPGDRARLLRRFAVVVDDHIDELAALEVRNSGHTVGNATWEAGNVRDVLNYYSAAPERMFGRQIPVPGGVDITFHEPLGVVGIIVPVELPDADRQLGFRSGAGSRQHRRAQAGRAHTDHRPAPRRAGGAQAGIPADVFTGRCRAGVIGRRASGSSPRPAWFARCVFTGSTEVGRKP